MSHHVLARDDPRYPERERTRHGGRCYSPCLGRRAVASHQGATPARGSSLFRPDRGTHHCTRDGIQVRAEVLPNDTGSLATVRPRCFTARMRPACAFSPSSSRRWSITRSQCAQQRSYIQHPQFELAITMIPCLIYRKASRAVTSSRQQLRVESVLALPSDGRRRLKHVKTRWFSTVFCSYCPLDVAGLRRSGIGGAHTTGGQFVTRSQIGSAWTSGRTERVQLKQACRHTLQHHAVIWAAIAAGGELRPSNADPDGVDHITIPDAEERIRSEEELGNDERWKPCRLCHYAACARRGDDDPCPSAADLKEGFPTCCSQTFDLVCNETSDHPR